MSRRVAAAVAAAVLSVLVVFVFLPTLAQGWAPIDDALNFVRNDHYRGLGWENLRWMWTTRHGGHFIPLTWMTLGADYLASGMEPRGYHRTNLLLHLANALLFFVLALRLLGAPWSGRAAATAGAKTPASGALPAGVLGAFAAAAWFALHPLRVESVAWITERRDLLCGLFCLLAVLAYVDFAGSAGRRRRIGYRLSLVLFAAALLSKGLAVVLPLALLALDAGPLRRLAGDPRRWRLADLWPVLREKVPFFALSALSASATLWAGAPVIAGAAIAGLEHRLLAASFGLTFYLEKSFWPVAIPFQIPTVALLSMRADPGIALRGLAFLLLLGLTMLLWWRFGRPQAALALGVFTAFVLPVSGLLQAGPQLAAHRYTYLACLPLALLVGGLVDATACGPRRGLRRLVPVGVGALTLLLVSATRHQVELWRDEVSFCRAAVRDAPLAWEPVSVLARAHLHRGEDAMAVRILRAGRRRFPEAILLPNMEAMALATSRFPEVRDGVEAVDLARRTVAITSAQDPAALLSLAAATAEAGDSVAASRLLDSARALATVGRKPELIPAIEEFRRRLEREGIVRLSGDDWRRLIT